MIDRVFESKRESKTVDFKRSFDPANSSEWCELVKDVVAMANSGGGYIIFGVADDGSVSSEGWVADVLEIDPAHITDKIAKYTGVQFDGFAIAEAVREGSAVAVLAIPASLQPMIFEKPGTYATGDGKQKTAFGVGTLYVRHGAKSEPANSADLARILDRFAQTLRREWMSGVRRVVNAPVGSSVSVLPPEVRQSTEPDAVPIRITSDSTAPEYRLVDPDSTHPWRQKELIAEINGQLPPDDRINQFDIQAVRHLYGIDGDHRYVHKAKFAAPQYSAACRDLLIGHHRRDHNFFRKAREEFKRRRDRA